MKRKDESTYCGLTTGIVTARKLPTWHAGADTRGMYPSPMSKSNIETHIIKHARFWLNFFSSGKSIYQCRFGQWVASILPSNTKK